MSDTRVSTASSDRFDQHLAAAGEFLRNDDVESARGELSGALSIRPEDVKALGLFGLACFRMSAFADALPIYQKLVELRPNDASHRLNLGLVHLKLGHAEDAITELVRSRELDPSQQRTVSYLGLAYARLGQFAGAYEAFLRAGQDQLAQEMEQHLSEEERAAIRARLGSDDEESSPPDLPVAEPAQEEVQEEVQEEAPPTPRQSLTAAFLQAHDAGEPADEEFEEGPRGAAQQGGAFGAALRAATRGGEDEADEGGEAAPAPAADPAPAPAPEPPAPRAKPRTAPPPPPGSDGRPQPMEAQGMISRAVELAGPTGATTTAGRVGVGQSAPQPLTQLATARLIRPEDGDSAFEIGAGGFLIVRVVDRIWSRTEEVVVSCGDLAFEPATRRVRGRSTGEMFADHQHQMFIITGKGYLVASPAGQVFTAVELDDDIVYLREKLVFAFEEDLRWESGHVPGSNAQMHVVQFRGQGSMVLRSKKPLLSLKLAQDRVVYVESSVLAGWIGRVVPRVVTPASGGGAAAPFVECSGEGVVLIEDQGSA